MTTLPARMAAARRGFTTAGHGTAVRFAALAARRQELLQDAGLAVVLAGVNVVSLLPYRAQLHPFWLALLLVVGQAVPLTWRRELAIPVGVVIGGCRVAYDAIGLGFAPFPLGPAIAVYTIFDRCNAVRRWLTFALLAAGITISQSSPGHSEPYEAVFQILVFAAAITAGVLSRAKRTSLQASESRAARAEAELDREAARASAAERGRIARELHDVVAHHVSLMAVQAEAAAALLPGQPEQAQHSVGIIGDTARAALTELRRLLGVLRGPSQRLDVAPAASLSDLGSLLPRVREAGLPVQLEIVGEPAALAPGVELTAFRIIQEALTNTLRHADASSASVTVSYAEPGFVVVSVTNSGPRARSAPAASPSDAGPAAARPGLVPGGAGFGLAGIAERVASCGGSLSVGPTAATGFAVTARLPVR